MADSLGGALADARVTCSPSADAKCVECADDERDQSFCAKNGWKIQMHCLESRSGENQTFLEAETSSYIKFDPCPISFSGFVRFEFFMMLCFALSFYYVQRRKRRLEVIQQWRIASY